MSWETCPRAGGSGGLTTRSAWGVKEVRMGSPADANAAAFWLVRVAERSCAGKAKAAAVASKRAHASGAAVAKEKADQECCARPQPGPLRC